jgi:hypothetical protein
MASKTIYGKFDEVTHQITFQGQGGGDCALDYCGEMDWDHEGGPMVAVTIGEENCWDTYYGCIDWTTGLFEVKIPDDCIKYFCDLGQRCFPAGCAPKWYKLTFFSVSLTYPENGWPQDIPVDGVCYLPCYSFPGIGHIWDWTNGEMSGEGWEYVLCLSNCPGGEGECDWTTVVVSYYAVDYFRAGWELQYHNHYANGQCEYISRDGIVNELSYPDETFGGVVHIAPAYNIPSECPQEGGPCPDYGE